MSNKGIKNEETGCAGNVVGMEEPRTQTGDQELENRSKLAQKSDNITMTLARPTRDITHKQTGEREQSTAKKLRSTRKQGLMAFFREGERVPPSSMDGTPIDAVKMCRTSKNGESGSKKKREKGNGNKTIGRKKSKLDNKESHEGVVDLEQMEKMPLKVKGTKSSTRKGKARKDKEKNTPNSGKKNAMFAETMGKEEVKEKEIEYKTCVVGFAVRVDKTKDTKGGFDKKLLEGLLFMQTYINQHVSFHPIKLGTTLKPIKEKGEFPKFQVTSRNYFCVPNSRAFDNISSDGGRTIKGSAIMGFTGNPEQCPDNAAGDLRTMGCAIYYKKCQEVDTVTSQILISISNTIKEEIIKQTLDKELKNIKQILLKNDKEYRLTREQSNNWIRYAVMRDFPAGMPWEGTEEKKQKQGTSNARLAYGLHVHRPDYGRLKSLLAYAKDNNIWDKVWGNTAYTIKTPAEKDPIGVKNKYIHMVQTHGSVQLSMGAATIERMIDVDTVFELRLLPDADGKPRQPTKTTVKEIFSTMMINEHKVWTCLPMGTNSMTTGYFSSIVPAIRDHIAPLFCALRPRSIGGCATEDVSQRTSTASSNTALPCLSNKG
jgi:hypothetical protein